METKAPQPRRCTEYDHDLLRLLTASANGGEKVGGPILQSLRSEVWTADGSVCLVGDCPSCLSTLTVGQYRTGVPTRLGSYARRILELAGFDFRLGVAS